MIEELKRAVLTVDLPQHNLRTGDMGVVVHAYETGAAYEVEFFTADGDTIDVVTVEAEQIRPATNFDVLHARPIAETRS